MTTMNDAFPSKYLSAEDLRGQDHAVTIERYQAETFPSRDGSDEQKYVLFFKGAKKGLVLNKTNAKTIASQHGNDFNGWLGKQVTIGVTWVEAFGEQTLAIRVRPALIGHASPDVLPANPPTTAAETPLGQPLTDQSVAQSHDDLNDDIPF